MPASRGRQKRMAKANHRNDARPPRKISSLLRSETKERERQTPSTPIRQPANSCALRPLESRQNVPPLEVPDTNKKSPSRMVHHTMGWHEFAKEYIKEHWRGSAKPNMKELTTARTLASPAWKALSREQRDEYKLRAQNNRDERCEGN